MLYAGIDNGKHGGISVINEKQEIQLMVPMPIIETGKAIEYDLNAIARIFQFYPANEILICLEKCYMLPRNGCKQNFSTGWNMGVMEGMFAALGLSYEIVAPQTWQKEIFQGVSVVDTKQASIMLCKRKWPDIDLKIGNGRKENDGISDSLCMALYILRKNLGVQNE